MSDIYVPTLDINEAVLRFRQAGISMNEVTLSAGIEMGLYPFAVCIKTKQGARKEKIMFEIYTKLLDEYLAERVLYVTADEDLIISMSTLRNTKGMQGCKTDKSRNDVALVPDFVKDGLVEPIINNVATFLNKPDVQEKLEKWLESRKKQRKSK